VARVVRPGCAAAAIAITVLSAISAARAMRAISGCDLISRSSHGICVIATKFASGSAARIAW
jgi:hypothetical protein